MSSQLEQQYRRALRWYPRGWRTRHQAVLLGILLDQAEAEGRTHMSTADRSNLTRQGLARRLGPVLLGALLLLAVLAAAQIISMANFGTGFSQSLLFVPPAFPAVPAGGSWTPPFILQFEAWNLYLICAVVLLGSLAGSGLLIRSFKHR